MQKDGIWLQNNYIRIVNPLENGDGVNYELDPNDYDFRFQKKNYDKLKASLEPYNIFFEKIYSKHRYSQGDHLSDYSFVVESNGPVVWHKRFNCGIQANNFVYIGKEKFKLSEWLKFSQEKQAQLLNSLVVQE